MAEKLVIDHDFRRITIPERKQLLGVVNDMDVNVMEFECPRYYGSTDLSTFSIGINYVNANGEYFQYPDPETEQEVLITIVGDGDDAVLNFDWVVGQNACAYAGDVRFNVFAYHEEGSSVDKAYHTIVYTLPVVEGLEP